MESIFTPITRRLVVVKRDALLKNGDAQCKINDRRIPRNIPDGNKK